jgi:guanylate kinase
MEKKEKGLLIVLSGPSGAGKSTVVKKLMQKRGNIHFSVSYTTRAPRNEDIDGVTYNFVDRAEFERMIANNEFLEYAEYSGNYYGTSLKVIEEKQAAGIDVLLDIEVQGAANVRNKCPDAVLVFTVPPSYQELERRLRGRNTDDEQTICKRLSRALEEVREINMYDYLVINDEVDNAVTELDAIMSAAECRIANRRKIMDQFV